MLCRTRERPEQVLQHAASRLADATGFGPCAEVRAGQAVWREHDSLGGDMADGGQEQGCGRTAGGVCRTLAPQTSLLTGA